MRLTTHKLDFIEHVQDGNDAKEPDFIYKVEDLAIVYEYTTLFNENSFKTDLTTVFKNKHDKYIGPLHHRSKKHKIGYFIVAVGSGGIATNHPGLKQMHADNLCYMLKVVLAMRGEIKSKYNPRELKDAYEQNLHQWHETFNRQLRPLGKAAMTVDYFNKVGRFIAELSSPGMTVSSINERYVKASMQWWRNKARAELSTGPDANSTDYEKVECASTKLQQQVDAFRVETLDLAAHKTHQKALLLYPFVITRRIDHNHPAVGTLAHSELGYIPIGDYHDSAEYAL